MVARLIRALRARPVATGLKFACALALVVVALGNIAAYARFLVFREALDGAFAPTPSGRTFETAWSFPFQESRCMVRVEVDSAELAALEPLDTPVIFDSPGWIRRQCVSEVVAAQAASPVVGRLADEFRRIRAERDLDPDEYLELMVAGIQAIPYGDTEAETLLAAEVIAGSSGICTDKSLLLASLLVHEGYDTVLWVFSSQRHVALGVASDAATFQGTGYAFVETTVPAFVGQAAPEYRAAGPVMRLPATVRLGGSRVYGSGEQVEAILGELGRLRALTNSAGDYASLARSQAPHRDRYAARALDYWVADARATYILTNTHDRPGVYAIVSGASAGLGEQASGP